MNYKMEITKATTDDISKVLELYTQLDNEKILNLNDAHEIFKKFELYPNYSLYVAKIDDRIIVTFELLIMDNLAHRGLHPQF